MYFVQKTTITGAKTRLGPRFATAHLDVITQTQRSFDCVQEYCHDSGKPSAAQCCLPFCFGTWPTGNTGNQGGAQLAQMTALMRERRPLTLLQLLDEGVEPAAVAGHMQYWQQMRRELQPTRGTKHRPWWVFLHSAESGTGKTFWVDCGGLEAWLQQLNATQGTNYSMDDVYVWQGGSGGNATWVTEDAIGKRIWIWPETAGQHCTMDACKTLIDRGPCRMQCKGGFVECLAEIHVWTTNFTLEEHWAKLKLERPDHWQRCYTALKRRLDEFGYFPDFRRFLREKRLEARLTQQGGLRVVEPTRRVEPEEIDTENMPPLRRTDSQSLAWYRAGAQ